MKISDEELQKWINNIELMGTQTHLLPFLTELQQLREERRWRDMSEEIPEPQDDVSYQFSPDGKTVGKDIIQFYIAPGKRTPMWIKAWDFRLFPTEELISEYPKPCWRPLPMDLPEVE